MIRIIIAVSLILAAVTIGAWALLMRVPNESDGPSATPTVAPGAGNFSEIIVTPSATTTSATVTLQRLITDALGNALAVRDFLSDATVRIDSANAGRYLLAGNLGTCVLDQSACQAGESVPYTIYYTEATQSFTIGITEEPVGEHRRRAEQALLRILGINERDLCRLKYYIGTTEYVNQTLAGRNLGFSHCEGAVVLP